MEGKNLKIKLMREYTASLLFIHLTFGVWANREELFLLRTAQKGTEKNFPIWAACPSPFISTEGGMLPFQI